MNHAWAVYTVAANASAPVHLICEQREFEAKARARPDRYTLVRGHIPSEAEAERLARGTAGDGFKSPTVHARWRFGRKW